MVGLDQRIKAAADAAGLNGAPAPAKRATGPAASAASATTPPVVRALDPDRIAAWALAALQAEAEKVATATEGTRNDTLNIAAFNLGQLVAAHALERDTVTNALTDAAHSAGLPDHEIEGTLASGLRAGEAEPRQPPDSATSQVGGRSETAIATVLDDATGDDAGDRLARFNIIDWSELKRAEDTGEDWILEPLIAAGRMTALYSVPKAGKSLLVLEIAAAVALGLPTLGQPARPPRNVLIVDFENDPIGDIRPRLEDMGHDLDDLEGHLFVAVMPSMAKLDTPQGGVDLLLAAQAVEAEVVIIDTVSRTITGEENDNNTWLAFYRNTGIPLKRENIACLRLDHAGKDAEKGMRGGSAKYGDVDLVWRLTALSETVIQLDCTDHRMRLDTTSFALVRHVDPLRHDVDGDPFTVAMNAQERELDAAFDRLGLPNDVGRRRAGKALREAGISVRNTTLARVLKARKYRLPERVPDTSERVPDTSGRCVPDTSGTRVPDGVPTPRVPTPPKGGHEGAHPPCPGTHPICTTCDEPIDDHRPDCPRKDR